MQYYTVNHMKMFTHYGPFSHDVRQLPFWSEAGYPDFHYLSEQRLQSGFHPVPPPATKTWECKTALNESQHIIYR